MGFLEKVKTAASAVTNKKDTRKTAKPAEKKEVTSEVSKDKPIHESANSQPKTGTIDKTEKDTNAKHTTGINNNGNSTTNKPEAQAGAAATGVEANEQTIDNTVQDTEPAIFTPKTTTLEKMGWNENDTKDALEALENAMIRTYSSNNNPYAGLFDDMPIKTDELIEVSGNNYSVALNGGTATVTIRGKDGFSDVNITTPFSMSQLQSCMDIVGSSGQENGLQFVQKGTNGTYNDQCLGMSAIYGAMLKDESAYFKQTTAGWQQNSDSRLQWNNDVLKGNINSCTDMDNYSKMTFGGKGQDRQTAAENMKNTIIENLQEGNPVIVEVGAIHNDSSLSRHYVTAIGYTTNSDGTPKDVVVWDPFTGDCRTLNYSYEEQGRKPTDWIREYDGDRIPVTGRDVGKSSQSDNPDEFQIFVWKDGEAQTPRIT